VVVPPELVAAGLAVVGLTAAACGAAPGRPGVAPEASHDAARRGSEGDDAGAVRPCLHDARDAKDLAACGEECDRGIASSCTLLAQRLERGDGIALDLPRAVRLEERACEVLQDPGACVNAARMHAEGRGVPPSRARQIELLAAACTLGDPFACVVPARALATGSGVVRDPRRATDLWQRACAGGVERACEAIGEGAP